MAFHEFTAPVALTGAGAACALGTTLVEAMEAMACGRTGLRPLGESGLAVPDGMGELPAGWIPDRGIFKGRRYGAAGNAAVQVAREAVTGAGWSKEEMRTAWLYVGTSRGNAGERAGTWAARRPVRKFAASNSMHSEVAAAVSLQLGLQGPWQVLSNGCAAGLDALGHASLAVALGWTRRALVVAVDLPLVVPLLEDFASTGLLTVNGVQDPYGPDTSGFSPGEGVAAVAVEITGDRPVWTEIAAYAANSDAHDAVALPPDGVPLSQLIKALARDRRVVGLSPHATGTAAHRDSESAALGAAFPPGAQRPGLHVFKPFTGHALGASGLLDVALLAGEMRWRRLPGNLAGLTGPGPGWSLSPGRRELTCGDGVVKVAAGMGGHNAGVVLAIP